MAKLNKDQKAFFNEFKEMMGAQGDYAFLFDRENGISALAVFTGNMKNHVRIIVAYCGEKDTFKKKIGFNECVGKLEAGEGVVLSADFDNLMYCLQRFLSANFSGGCYWQTL